MRGRTPLRLHSGALTVKPYWKNRGLLSAYAHIGAGLIDLTGRWSPQVAISSNVAKSTGRYGPGGLYNGSSAQALQAGSLAGGNGSNTLSKITALRWDSGDTVSGDSANNGRACLAIGSTGTITLISQAVAGFDVAPAGTVANGETCVIGVSYDGTTGKGFKNGRAAGSGSGALTFGFYNAPCLGLASGGTSNLSGLIYLNLEFERVLSDAEMRVLTTNPWEVFQPARAVFPTSVGGGGGGAATRPRIFICT